MKNNVLFILLSFFISCSQTQMRKTASSPFNTKVDLNSKKELPNVILILADDLGVSDLGFMGSEFYESPNLDKLAKEGIVFKEAYTSGSVCSPTRAALMSGKNPARLKITNWIPGGYPFPKKLKVDKPFDHLPLSEYTVAEAFRDQGYKTAIIGKWHLGGEKGEPEKNGFDINIGAGHEGHPKSYFSPYKLKNLHQPKKGEYLTDRLTDESIKFITENSKRPFFLYLPFYTVHFPLQAKKKDIKYFKKKRKELKLPRWAKYIREKKGNTRKFQNHPTYAAMIKSMDENIGKLLKSLKDQGLEENTIIVFSSDNGGFSTYNRFLYPFFPPATSNAPYRAGKGYPYEGGIKTSLIMKWPKKIKSALETNSLAVTADIYPTLLSLAGLPKPKNHIIDGINLSPVLLEGDKIHREGLFWHFPHYHIHGVGPYTVVRVGDFKLIYYYENKRYELYNVVEDISETRNLALEYPEKLEELKAFMEKKKTELDVFIPKKRF